MEKQIKKSISEEDKKAIYNFFNKHKDLYKKTPITSKVLSILTGYSVKDIPLIVKGINYDPKYKNIILGSCVGFYLVDKSNILKGFNILKEKIAKSNNELEYAYFLKEKLTVLD